MVTSLPGDDRLTEAFAIVENTPEIEAVIVKLRDFLNVDHAIYYSSKFGTTPSADPYVRLTYPGSWIKRYVQMGYSQVDPVLREGFKRTLPFSWNELSVENTGVASFLADAVEHGVGPYGFSVPVFSKHRHRGLFSISSSRSEQEWAHFLAATQATLIQVANRLHRRVVVEVFGEDLLHLSGRELECLRWVASGKETGEIAVILSISPHTVRDYLKSARHKLDCVTSAQAVSKAVKLGILVL